MGKKSRQKAKVERDKQKKAAAGAAGGSGEDKSEEAEKAAFTSPPSFDGAAAKPSTVDTQDEPTSTTVSASDSTTAVAEKLRACCSSCTKRQYEDIKTWVLSELSGDFDAVKAAARRGDAKAQYAFGFMMICGVIPDDDAAGWQRKAAEQGYPDGVLACGVLCVDVLLQNARSLVNTSSPEELKVNSIIVAKKWLTESAVEHNSAEAQYLMGMLDCYLHGCARSKPDMLETARWFRAAVHQGLKEAQWELGEMFRKGVFCDVHMFFARQYIKRAAKQGHAEALQRVRELCRCVYCGAERAPWKCSTCLETRYCDSTCSTAHWRRGGGVSEVCEATLPHRKTCPRTYDDPCDA
jgi:TPR repeat protein